MWKRIGKNGNKYWGNKGAGIFFTDGKKVLLLKRAEKSDSYGPWGLPGGKVEEGETLIDAARRESKEECGKVKGQRFEDLKETDGQHNWTTFFFKIQKPFSCKLSNEHSDWKWFDINELDKINLHPKLKENLDRHLKIVKKYFSNLTFKEWLVFEAFSSLAHDKKPHVNKIGSESASDLSLVKGPKAWNQSQHNCYQIASSLAEKFGFEPVGADEVRSIVDQYKRYWASKNISWIKSQPPKAPKEGIANFVIRMGDELMYHISFEYRGKEYNYGASSHEGFSVLCKIGLKPKL